MAATATENRLNRGKTTTRWTAVAVVLAVLLLTALAVQSRFQGPAIEKTFEEFVLAQNLAAGKGFVTDVYHPQAVAVLEGRRELSYAPGETIPDLYNAPLYPMVLALSLAILPEGWRASLFRTPGEPTGAFGADVYFMAVNVLLFWSACLLVFLLAKRLFGARVGILTVLGLVLSAGVWDSVLSMSGVSLLMLLISAVFLVWTLLEEERKRADAILDVNRKMLVLAGVIGAITGLLFLTEYSGIFLLLGFLVFLLMHYERGPTLRLFNVALGAFLIVTAPWLARNLLVQGHPMALAGHELVQQRVGAEYISNPNKQAFQTFAPPTSARAITAKGFTGIREVVGDTIWSGGSFVFVPFFVSALLYQFRRDLPHRLFLAALVSGAILLALPPFFDSGIGPRTTGLYLAPLFLLFGGAFLLILLYHVSDRPPWQRRLLLGLVLGLHGFPLLFDALQPPAYRTSWPPYHAYELARYAERLPAPQSPHTPGIMSDLPAGAAWYLQRRVWGIPTLYRAFVDIQERQETDVLLFTPNLLAQPFYHDLAQLPPVPQDILPDEGWHHVYRGLAYRIQPLFFPLPLEEFLAPDLVALTRNVIPGASIPAPEPHEGEDLTLHRETNP